MKTLLYLAGALAVVLVGLGFFGLWMLGLVDMPRPAPQRTPPPAGFVASDYPDLADLSGTAAMTVHDLQSYGTYFEGYFLPDQKVAYFTFLNPEGVKVVCVGANGAIIGVVEGPAHLFPIGNVFVDIDRYHRVSADSVAPPAPYQLIGTDLGIDALWEYHAESTLYWIFPARDAGPDRPEYTAGEATHVMLHDGVWKKATTRSEVYLEAKTAPFHDLDKISTMSFQTPQTLMHGRYVLSRPYFDQQDHYSARSAPIGSTTGTGRPEFWQGTGYYTLSSGADTLRFSIADDIMNLSGFGPVRLQMLGADDLDFVFIDHSGSNGAKMTYLVTASGG